MNTLKKHQYIKHKLKASKERNDTTADSDKVEDNTKHTKLKTMINRATKQKGTQREKCSAKTKVGRPEIQVFF